MGDAGKDSGKPAGRDALHREAGHGYQLSYRSGGKGDHRLKYITGGSIATDLRIGGRPLGSCMFTGCCDLYGKRDHGPDAAIQSHYITRECFLYYGGRLA